MKLVHLSDLHLGFRQYHRLTERGINQREADVALAFRKAIDRIIEIKPGIVVIAGDVFHAVRPTNPAILHAYTQFERLTQMLPDTSVVMIAGNHDTPRTTETGWILRLFRSLGVLVVEDRAERVTLPGKEVSVLAVPSIVYPLPRFEPDKDARYNILLLHRMAEGIVNRFGAPDPPGGTVNVEKDIVPGRWTYVALGHYHVYRQLAANAFFSGALEYTSSNIWGEVDEEAKLPRGKQSKGFIAFDLESGEATFETVELARRVVDLPQIEAGGMTASEISDAIEDAVTKCEGGIDDRIVRLIVRDVPRHVLRDIDHRRIRDYKRRALNFLLDARKPDPVRIHAVSGAPGRRPSLAETVKSMLEQRPITPGIDRKALVDLGMHYLNEADRLAPALTGDEA